MAKSVLKNAPLLTEAELHARLPELYDAIDQFNDGYWFESHETLEDLWQVTPLPERTFFQGIIQAAAALVHYARGEGPGILKLLDAALDKLQDFKPETLGVNVSQLVDDLDRVRNEFAALGGDVGDWDESDAPRIEYRRAA
jgi:hypothetical protein